MNRRLAVRGIVVHDGKLLCVKLKPYSGALGGDYWCVPGGGVDPGEPIIDALHREMIEETGVEPQIGNLLYVQQFTRKKDAEEEVEFFFEITNAHDYLAVDLSKTTHGLEEIEEIAFIDPAANTVKPTFLSEESLQELPAHPKFFSYFT